MSPPDALIYEGQTFAEAEQVLQSRKIDYRSQVRAIQKLPDELQDFNFSIDEEHTNATIIVSKSTKKIRSIETRFFPAQKQSWITNQTALPAQVLRFNSDGSYEIRFKAPPTQAELDEWERKHPKNLTPPIRP